MPIALKLFTSSTIKTARVQNSMFDIVILIAMPILIFWAIGLHLTNKKPNLYFISALLAFFLSFISINNSFFASNNLSAQANHEPTPTIKFAFSPKQGATDAIIKQIQQAKKSIRVAAYAFTSKPIANALVKARKRGINVMVVLDGKSSKQQHSLYAFLLENNIPTRRNYAYSIMHNKFIIIDEEILQSGSFNYSSSAEKRNAENILIISHDHKVISGYLAQWNKLWLESSI